VTINDRLDIEQLESRLHRGWELIDEARRADDRRAVARYTQRWLVLLREYEQLFEPPEATGSRDMES
jgi:hypothetical protein